jgi:hypothetical protein
LQRFKEGSVMYGIDCVFELRKHPNRVQDCRVLVAFDGEWDTHYDAFVDAAAVVFAHVKRALVDGWVASAIHMVCLDQFQMEERLAQRQAGYAASWYDVPCRVIEDKKFFWVEGHTDG